MNKLFSAYDVTGFLDESIGGFLKNIEDIAIEMSEADDAGERTSLLDDLRYYIRQCNGVLR